MLDVAVNMNWPEVGEQLARNPFLVPGLLEGTNEEPGILFAGNLLLAWSKLGGRAFLRRLVGYIMDKDISSHSRDIAIRMMGTQEFAREHPDMVARIASDWVRKLNVALAISWQRCNKRGLSD